MFLITSFSSSHISQVMNFINSIVFLLVLLAIPSFFIYKAIEAKRRAKSEWVSNIPNAIKNLDQKRLSVMECLNLLDQAAHLPKGKDPERLFMMIYLHDQLARKHKQPLNEVSFILDHIARISVRSGFLTRVLKEELKVLKR